MTRIYLVMQEAGDHSERHTATLSAHKTIEGARKTCESFETESTNDPESPDYLEYWVQQIELRN